MSPTRLEGLRTRPLAGYLSAIGLLRVVSEQLTPDVTGCWRGDTFEIAGPGLDDLCSFLVEDYCPTPVFSPWNKEGDPEQNDKTRSQLKVIRDAGTPRFDAYRDTMTAYEALRVGAAWRALDYGKSTDVKKERIKLWRSWAPDATVPWVDAAVVQTADGDVKYSPLLGTGGNDGRFEVSRLFQGELIRLLMPPHSTKHAAGWLRALLTGAAGPPLVDATLGQFDADAAGGINAGAVETPNAASNPWAIVLTIEGTIALAAGTASRLGVGTRSIMSVPFMVRPSALDSDDGNEDSRGELWAPLWERPVAWPELRRHLAEGRLQWSGRGAASALDASRAVGSLGISRGVSAFERYGFLNRNGKAFVAAPRGTVTSADIQGVGLFEGIDQWTGRLPHGDRVPTSLLVARRRLDQAMFRVATGNAAPRAFLDVLAALADVESSVRRSGSVRERVGPIPADLLPAEDWLSEIVDGSRELRVAAGLASLADPHPRSDVRDDRRTPIERSAGLALRQITRDGRGRLRWPVDPDVADPAASEMARNPAAPALALFARRLQGASTTVPSDQSRPIAIAPFSRGLPVPIDDMIDLLNDALDLHRVHELARACSLLDWTRAPGEEPAPDRREPRAVPPWFAAMRLCLLDTPLAVRASDGSPSAERWVLADRSWARRLTAGRVDDSALDAVGRLRRHGFSPLRRLPASGRVHAPERVALALLCRLSRPDSYRLRRAVDPFWNHFKSATTERGSHEQPPAL
jgi:CRISPR-associated protein Csx17